jgi:hypothetical protein
MQPIKELVIYDDKTADGYNALTAKIGDNGDLILAGVDAGKDVEKFFGDSDYEYWLTMPQEFKETILLYLIKERFSSVHDMKAWLEEKEILCTYTSY